MSKKNNRLKKIISIVKDNNGASVKDLSSTLDVSEMTIRRDIKLLEDKNIVESYYGSVVYNHNLDNPIIGPNSDNKNTIEYNLNLNSLLMDDEKSAIGKKAAELIKEDDVVIIDVGTTTEKLSQYINELTSFTALIFSCNNLLHLMNKPKVNLIMAGGNFHKDTGMFESKEALSIIDTVRARKVFLSAAGVHDKLGVTCANPYEIETKKHIMKNSLEIILLIDSSKFGTVKSSHFCDLNQIDTIITDCKISDEWKNIIDSNNIKLIIADK
ncbi:DeoR/GlpR family DNA-binding transcription regulator [Peptostreptococcus equinus]|uniref:DeoR/GlpR family DNA-binding transcription regulator n=1 Tax=Peptostreptococcus equinus TaxID=3003601 RepID=A0ABY7JRF5_9FIRM|nr:DeoR/GlpR family DNA-binding transcription regulator [Peptostreptococcus sp. CBA3647]WAW15076.1 DeoR/GlpR family DNA-binding transcription regulator [Peptostreptococcus sp. CBA3647]